MANNVPHFIRLIYSLKKCMIEGFGALRRCAFVEEEYNYNELSNGNVTNIVRQTLKAFKRSTKLLQIILKIEIECPVYEPIFLGVKNVVFYR